MKIKKITIKDFNVKLKKPFTYFNVTLNHLPYALIIIEFDSGILSYGEVSLAWDITGETQKGVYEILDRIKSLLKNKEINEIVDIENILKDINFHIYANTALKCGLEMAFLDGLGKLKKKPIYKLLGGKNLDFIIPQKVLDYNEQDFNKIFGIIKSSLEKGTKIFKLKTGNGKIIETLQKIFEQFPNIDLVLDVNQGWINAEKAIFLIKKIEKFNILWIEQPIFYNDYDGFSKIREKTSIPIMADESCHDLLDLENLVKRKCVDFVNIKLAKSGGIFEAKRMIEFCEKNGIKYMLGDMIHSEIGTAYNIHAATIGNFVAYDLTTPDRLADKNVKGLCFEKAKVYIPQTEGLGIEIINKNLM